jgi:predicted DNA-binding protein YlxM (UPF0122 family)
MATIEDKKLKEVKNLYKQEYSAREIAKELNVSIDAVYYFLRKHNIPRRSARENNAVQFWKKRPSFKVKSRLTHDEELLKIAGIMLYWGEGSKWPGEVIVDFANSNVDMIEIFLAFLRRVCGINEKKLRAYLYCYKNQNPNKLVKFWSKVTKIPTQQFTKPYIRKDFRSCKTDKMKYGLLHVRYYDKKLLLLIKEWIKDFLIKH